MKVLQVNVRLQEGGAARIALDLHIQLLNSGIQSKYAYGWGENGGKSSAEVRVPHSFQVGQQIQVASNLLLHKVAGIDFIPPSGGSRKSLVDAFDWADIIHLHAIHSYFLPFGWLVNKLILTGKPVVWTAHDYWMLTGRCAFTEGCDSWLNGCGSCLTQKNYPSSYFDFSASQFKIKRQFITELGSQLQIITPSEFVAKLIREGLPTINVRVIPNWVDSEFEASLRHLDLRGIPVKLNADKIKVIIIANDLSDPTKVDRALVNQLITLPHIVIHTVGRNSPFSGANVVNHGRITQRQHVVHLISLADVALFTSEKDTFGLVMIEALACGIPVFAIDSLASKEVLGRLGLKSIRRPEILERLTSLESFWLLPKDLYSVSRTKLLSVYGVGSGINAYLDYYKNCLKTYECSNDTGEQ